MQFLSRFGAPTGAFFIVCIALILLSGPLARMLLPLRYRPGQEEDAPEISAASAARSVAVLALSASFWVMDHHNAIFFLALACCCGLSFLCLIARYRRQRRQHSGWIPCRDAQGAPIFRLVPMGSESELYDQVQSELSYARVHDPELTMKEFILNQGDASQRPAAWWPPAVLVATVARLHTLLVLLILSGISAAVLCALALAAICGQ
ncbi:hypothetical protein [Xylophilus sp. GOD-11R]|uniref:hypothetical protein n=1 Tax=Xylophilus sp. GOD-11R TaxID=3089814 RepID=UPI00298CB31F|nr:hypothetical protein [Xylophilus sp. GOD-11R]WPB56900.1 hypothetical protein R9X41_22655 [Xylophilus sp. GOD-11R]